MTDDLLISHLLRETTPAQAQYVEDWRRQDAANEARFKQLQLVWEASLRLQYTGTVNAQASLQRLKQKAAKQPTVVTLQPWKPWLSIAAAVLVIITAALFYITHRNTPGIQIASNLTVKTDTLPDGSVLTLNKGAQIELPAAFTGKERQVVLTKGEVFFEVAPDQSKPFIIHTGDLLVQVLGTSFNVKNKNGNIEVIVETGRVQVSRQGHTLLLNRGEKVVVQQQATALTKAANPDQLYTYYRSKEFVADNTPLWRMVEVLNEAYDSHIIIGRKELHDLPLNTTFKNESLDNILQVICRTFNITLEKKNDQLILK
jgi:ferric-dicitrate binding protein FerR (iron transport regulator)